MRSLKNHVCFEIWYWATHAVMLSTNYLANDSMVGSTVHYILLRVAFLDGTSFMIHLFLCLVERLWVYSSLFYLENFIKGHLIEMLSPCTHFIYRHLGTLSEPFYLAWLTIFLNSLYMGRPGRLEPERPIHIRLRNATTGQWSEYTWHKFSLKA